MRNLKISARATTIILVLLTMALCLTSLSQAAESAMDTGAIERLTGATGALGEQEGVFQGICSPQRSLGDRRGRKDDATDGAHVVGGV